MTYCLLIDGALVPGDRTSPVINPATEELVADCPCASPAQLDAAVAAANRAFRGWSAMPMAERQRALTAIADRMAENIAPLADILTQEQGKSLAASAAEVQSAIRYFRHFATTELKAKTLIDAGGKRVEAHRTPLGVVAAIVPWNFPLALMAFKVPAALAAGNTVILKPAATTPLATLRFAEITHDLLPPGVLNVIADNNDLGALLTAHPDIRKISFTGSTATGVKVMQGAAPTLKRITLELGGNDAAIVLPDANPKHVAERIFTQAFRNSGQVCIAIKRLYVHDTIYDAVCNELAALAERAVVADGRQSGAELGPVQNKQQYDRVLAMIEDARTRGTVLTGGAIEGRGYFIRPTIVRDIAEGALLVDEEQFGPALPILRYMEVDDAIARANASPYGLGASVWTSDIDAGYAVARRLDAGTVWVNKHGELLAEISFGGAKQSGIGLELGEEGLAEFTQFKVINIATDSSR